MKIGVIGDGGWGTALALLLHERGHAVRIWGAFPEYLAEMRRTRHNRKFLHGVLLPPEIEFCEDFASFAKDAEMFLSVVPTVHLRKTMEKFRASYPAGTPIVSATKGIEIGTLRLPSEIILETLGAKTPVAVLAGPSHAEEVAQKLPASLVAASSSIELAKRVQVAANCDRFRVYTGSDPIGVELGSALKNILAIAAGICDGLELGDNAKAALTTRGLVEIARYGVARGAKRETFYGLTGLGDMLTTCFSKHSRNRAVGEKLGKGMKLDAILAETEMVAEGVTTTKAVVESKPKAEMPITEETYKVLFQGKDARQAMLDLMQRAPKEES